ncbi:MAG: extracellular solute-binding protein [Dysosmobacter sp.]|uniref:extracellular solute-binding protein n=1 Tax=uncultured Oscillibacter sp. TaxID=876091 RepID=UPI00261CE501|nr:extracellular solute-binding protein [uncultured Oscillibacter sp.]MCX4372318.1 extracellular solute-binding protein [Dysosmobacter sp.]
MRITEVAVKRICLVCLAAALLFVLPGCGDKSPLDPQDPVSLTVWHYYNGSQQAAFDTLVEEFNDTAGRERGIYVQSYSQGSVSDLESAVRDAISGKVGAEAMPDIFSSYADTAYEIEQAGALANLSGYLSQEELEQYVDSYIEEGRIAADGTLRIFPTAKSTEIMMLNKTDWEVFAADTGASLEDLRTIEGVAAVARTYYEWTDGLTPDVPGDGKAFYGRDAVANYFIIGLQQLGVEIFQVEHGEMTLHAPKEELRRLWENYYVPMVKGYFGAYGAFRSDDVKTGDILAYTGSTSSAMYFPDQVELDAGSHPIDYIVMPAPVFEGGRAYAVQQGAGMVVSRSDERREYASVEFLKWFTQAEENLRFGCVSGYLPVLKEAGSTEKLDQVIADQGLSVSPKTYDCLTTIFEELEEMTLYTNKSFQNGSAARKVLEYHLADRAAEDRAGVLEAIALGKSLEEASAEYVSDGAFEDWYSAFCQALNNAVGR